jgi:hypothetical protein
LRRLADYFGSPVSRDAAALAVDQAASFVAATHARLGRGNMTGLFKINHEFVDRSRILVWLREFRPARWLHEGIAMTQSVNFFSNLIDFVGSR